MLATVTRATIRGGCKIVAVALLIVLTLTPICSSICQAQSCQQPRTTAKNSGCHHVENMGNEGLAALTAASAPCGAREVLLALPEATDNLRDSRATSASPDADSWAPATAISLPPSNPTESFRGSSRMLVLERAGNGRFVYSFAILRI
jgi:hypothetical protein